MAAKYYTGIDNLMQSLSPDLTFKYMWEFCKHLVLGKGRTDIREEILLLLSEPYAFSKTQFSLCSVHFVSIIHNFRHTHIHN